MVTGFRGWGRSAAWLLGVAVFVALTQVATGDEASSTLPAVGATTAPSEVVIRFAVPSGQKDVVVAHHSLAPEVKAKLKECFLRMQAKCLEGVPAAGYVDRDDHFYDVVRALVDSEADLKVKR